MSRDGGQRGAPRPEKVAGGIHRLSLPNRSPWLRQVNAYVVEAPDGLLLIDAGYGSEQALATLETQLGELGFVVGDVGLVVLSHAHPDHIGLARIVAERSGAPVLMHAHDADLLDPSTLDDRMRSARAWFTSHGLAIDGARMRPMPLGHPSPNGTLEAGQELSWGGRRFQVLWTPGHSAGLVCLYDPDERILISSDHVLERITPNVSMRSEAPDDPLRDYLREIARVGQLTVELVLPGHGPPFAGLRSRTEQIAVHHDLRCAELLAVLAAGPGTAAQLAPRLEWVGSRSGWEQLDPINRFAAVGETVAHLRYLEVKGQVTAEQRDGSVVWRRPGRKRGSSA